MLQTVTQNMDMIKELMALRYLDESSKQVEPRKLVGHPIMALDLNQMMMKMSTRMILRRTLI